MGNISTRLPVGTGENVLFAGFIITGGDVNATKEVAIRGLGPSLVGLGGLADPILELHGTDAAGNDVVISTNDSWKTNSPADQTIITNSGLDQYAGTTISDSEAIIIANLAPVDPNVPNSGQYTAKLLGADGGTGIGLVEAYDLSLQSTSVLANISTRGLVQTGDNIVIGGLIIVGAGGQQVLVRGIGPSLTNITGPLANPTLEIHNADGDIIAFNDDWKSDQEQAIAATGIAPTNDAESAILITLNAGAYTAQLRGKDNTTGIGVIEAYQLDN